MDRKKWQRAKEVFADAVERPDRDRTAFVGSACGDDVELRASVESLLASRDPSTTFLEPPEEGAVPELLSAATQHNELGRRIGPYKLIEVIATGGMGTIYRAARADSQYETEVAVKLIKPGMDSVEAVRRFRRERQVLATLEHPNIARLLDGAVTEDGSPYLVMEYIAGAPIHKYCDESDLKVDRRLRLFRNVCAAVQHAHQALVVHRDLKPSNILVTPEGMPKLLDFGIAKLLDPTPGSLPADTTVTAFRLMTPQYASPEQIRGEPITTASDVYSLGVILYELLTGHRPYDIKTGSRAEMERILCDVEPATPSTAIERTREITLPDGTTGTLTPETVSARRGTRPEKLARSLRGDLDTIVLTAMHRDPSRRYGSVRQLSDDIDRYLRGLPVLARRDTFRYRAGKFVRRNKAAVIASAIAVVALVAGAAGTTVGMMRARDALTQSKLQTDRARDQARKAEHISTFLQDMLASAAPEELGADVTVRAVLDATSEGVDSNLEEDPEIRAVTHRTLGLTYLALGLYQPAREHLESALELRRSVFGVQNADTVQSLFDLGWLLFYEGEHAEAEKNFRTTMAVWRDLTPDDSREIASSLSGIGAALEAQGNLEHAEQVLRRALDMWREIDVDGSLRVAIALCDLGRTVDALGRYDEAERIFRHVLDTYRLGVHGTTELDIAKWKMKLGSVLHNTGRFAEAATLSRSVLTTLEQQLGKDHPRTLTALGNLATIQHSAGNLAAAERNYRESLARKRKVLGGTHLTVAIMMANLGLVLTDTGRLTEAEPLIRGSIDILRSRYGSTHPELANSLNTLAGLLELKKDFEGARAVLREALRIRREVLGDTHPRVGSVLNNLGLNSFLVGDYPEAERLFREALDVISKPLGSEHPNVEAATDSLAEVVAKQGRYAEAETIWLSALAIQIRIYGKEHVRVPHTLQRLALMNLKQNDPTEALRYIEKCRAALGKEGRSGHWVNAKHESIYGECLLKAGEYLRAEPVLLQNLKRLSREGEERAPQKHAAIERVVALYEALEKPEKAAEYRAMLPKEEPKTTETKADETEGNDPPAKPTTEGAPNAKPNG